eukprot:3254888-Pleurochrysis_carterae.AAC.3
MTTSLRGFAHSDLKGEREPSAWDQVAFGDRPTGPGEAPLEARSPSTAGVRFFVRKNCMSQRAQSG